MKATKNFFKSLAYLCAGLLTIGTVVATQSVQANPNALLETLVQGDSLRLGNEVIPINTARILDLGSNNFSSNHYEYFVVLSDGVYNGGNEYIGGKYTISIELLSLGNAFNEGTFQSCFFCTDTTSFSYVGHLFIVEDTNDDDIFDFNVDPFEDGATGFVQFIRNGSETQLTVDFTMDGGDELEGCFTGTFAGDPLSVFEHKVVDELPVEVMQNPTATALIFEVNSGSNQPYKYQLYNAIGALVTSGESRNQRQKIDVQQVPNGNYYLHVIQAGKIARKPIIVK